MLVASLRLDLKISSFFIGAWTSSLKGKRLIAPFLNLTRLSALRKKSNPVGGFNEGRQLALDLYFACESALNPV